MIGDEGDHGTSTLHFTPSVGPNFAGGCESAATPEALAPRNCGQFCAQAMPLERSQAEPKKNKGRIFMTRSEAAPPPGASLARRR